MPFEEVSVIGGFEAVQVDTYVLQQIAYDFVRMVRLYQRLRTAIGYACNAIDRMFIALGMTSKIVMVVQYEHLLVSSVLLLIEIGSRQSTDAAAYYNQVILLFQISGWPPICLFSPCLAMRVFV